MASVNSLSCRLGDLRREIGLAEDNRVSQQQRLEEGMSSGMDAVNVNMFTGFVGHAQGRLQILQEQAAAVERELHKAQGGDPGAMFGNSRIAGPRGVQQSHFTDQVHAPRMSGGYHSELGGDYQRPPLIFRNQETGARIQALEPGEPMSTQELPFGFGDYLVGRLRGDFNNLDEGARPLAIQCAQRESTVVGGGMFYTTELSNIFLDLARGNCQVIAAGARTLKMTSPEMVIARVTSDVTPQWRAEGEAVTASDMGFGAYIVRPFKSIALTGACREWLMDTPNGAEMIQQNHAAAHGVALDRIAFYGLPTGAGPTGLIHTHGLGEVPNVGKPTDWTEASTAIRMLLDSHYAGPLSSLAWIASPRDGGTYDNLQDTLHQPLRMPPWVSELRRFYGSAVQVTEGNGGNEATMAIGDFSEFVFFIKQELGMEILPSGEAVNVTGVTENALTEDKVWLRSTMRVDCVCLRPPRFVKLTGVTA
jgi:HK97 family phage major capsid protein